LVTITKKTYFVLHHVALVTIAKHVLSCIMLYWSLEQNMFCVASYSIDQ